jgi:DNA-binding MarR family transcriptional regulator
MAGRASDQRASPDAARVADAVHSAAIHLLRRLRRVDEAAGIGPARLSVLSVLVFRGPARLTDLAQAEQVRPPTMTKLVGSLERAGLVRRSPDPDDARAVRVEPTARGRRVLLQGRARRVRALAAALRDVSSADLDVLRRAAALMERLSRTLAGG